MVHIFAKPVMTAALVIGVLACCSIAEDYSCRAEVFMPDGYSQKTIVWSPDRKKYVRLSSKPEHAESDEGVFTISIYSGARLLKTFVPKDLSAATFVKWSPDSKGLYVMWSDGGAIGGYHVRAFLVDDSKAIESAGSRSCRSGFRQGIIPAKLAETIYMLFVGINGSRQLLLRPEVYPTSDCAPETALSAEYLVTTAGGKIY